MGRKLHSVETRVQVIAGSEAELTEILRLDPQHTIHLTMLAPTTGEGMPWRVALSRHLDGHRVDPVSQSSASREGVWQSPPLPPGRYQVSISTPAGDRWFEEDVLVGREDVQRVVSLEAIDVRGSVTMGGDPLEASVTLRAAGVSISTRSDERGRFVLLLPKPVPPIMIAEIHSRVPEVRRRVRVTVPEPGKSMIIALPKSVVMGEVVTAEGKPVENALVSIAGAGNADREFVQVRSASDGSFVAHALAAGRYDVVASDFLSESNHARIEISEDDSPEPLTLIVRPMRKLRGRVLSARGPVAGAQVEARAVDVPQMMSSPRVTDASGEFVLVVPPDARQADLFVSPPGFSFTMLGVVSQGEPVVVNVDQSGGTLTIVSDEDGSPLLVHNRATTAVALVDRGTTQASAGTRRTILVMMEPGAYAACIVDPRLHGVFRLSNGQTGGRCVTGVLPAHGSLTLDLRDGAKQ